ncbi:MAG: class I SAM-dependent methyltransferase [Actinomycetia bacterium]|nr:class I SAM-dependent methyltransferase [Actinomycetes bacterium]
MDADGWNQRYAGKEFVWSVEPNRFVAELTAGLSPGRAIDLAGGEGRNGVWLATRGWDATVVDFSQAGIDKVSTLAEAEGVSVTTICADLTEWSPEPDAYDLVLHVYLHLPADQRAQVYAAAVAAVAPGGHFVLIGHDRSNVENGYGGPPYPEILATPTEVVDALDGFEVIRAEVAERPVQTDDGERIALDTLVMARRSG